MTVTSEIKDLGGRPTKFTPERCASIVSAIRNRVPYAMAAEAYGICEDTLYEWLKIAREHKAQGIDSDYARFSESIKQAEMSRVIEHNEKIASNVDRWQADAWILERRWHKHYGPNASVNELNEKLDKLLQGKEKNEKGNEEISQENDEEK
jgi:transposase